MITKTRREWFGAIVYSEHPGMTAFVDHRRADYLGIPHRGNTPEGFFSAPLDVHLSITNRCNLHCPGCYARNERLPAGDMPVELAKRILDRLAAMEVFTVAFGGGEPLLHPHIFEIARYARDHTVVPNVTTNGLCIDGPTAEQCRVFGSIHLSCHHPSELDRLAQTVRLLRDADVHPGLNVLVSARTYEYLPEIARWCRRHGVTRALFLKFKITENNRFDRASLLSPKQERELLPVIRRAARRNGLMPMLDCSLFPALALHHPRRRDIEFFDVNGCQGANAYAAVTTGGMVKACSFCESVLGGIELLDRENWIACHEAEAFRTIRRQSQCKQCEYLDFCNGGCRLCASPCDE